MKPKQEGLPHLEGHVIGLYAYTLGCRCDGCRAAKTAAQMKYRDRGHPERAETRAKCKCSSCAAGRAVRQTRQV